MIVVRGEFKQNMETGTRQGGIDQLKSQFEEGGAFHNKAKEYRILGSYWSGLADILILEIMVERLGEWESVFTKGIRLARSRRTLYCLTVPTRFIEEVITGRKALYN